MTRTAKKLIEVALPLEAINKASALEKQPFTQKHPRSMHIWWARRPLVAARAVIFAQMVDDPSAHPDLFPTEKAQEKERKRLFKIIEELVQWENTNKEQVLQAARDEIWASWRRICAANADHPQANELFDRYKLPAFHDPFAGGGSLPVEAQRLGLEAYASDLNPVAVLINKAMIEIPPKFAGLPPINRESRADNRLLAKEWSGTQGIAEDVRYYGKWIREEGEKRIGHLYPKVEITSEMAAERPDLKPLLGQQLTVIAWVWVRTVKSPNPAFSHIDVPLASTFILSSKLGKEAYVEPVVEQDRYRFSVRIGKPQEIERAKSGTKLSRGANFRCSMSDAPISGEYIQSEAQSGRMGTKLMAIVAEGSQGRVYLSPQPEMEIVTKFLEPEWMPEGAFVENSTVFTPCIYGMKEWRDLFTPRQIVALTTFYSLVNEASDRARSDALHVGLTKDGRQLADGGTGAVAYSEAIAVYLALATSRWSDLSNTLCSWNNTNQNVRALFARQAIPMSWDFVELSPFSKVGSWFSVVETSADASSNLNPRLRGYAWQADAASQTISVGKVVSTDPPYYDNVPYADLSDFFYVWLRRTLRPVYKELFATLAVPKAEELVAFSYRHNSKSSAEAFFLSGMTKAMHRLAEQSHPAFPVTIYYAFKQSESGLDGATSTGWETFLEAVIRAGFAITGTWPIRTEREVRSRSIGSNALATSIVLVCRQRSADAATATRRQFVSSLKTELADALSHLQRSNIAPVDLAQAAIGPGMAVFTRYAQVLDAAGKPLSVREALALINQSLDETLAEQEGDFDADTRWALAWFEQVGFNEGEYGVAETLSKAKNTSVTGMVDAGILASSKGKVRLLRPEQLPLKWDPTTDSRLTAWEAVHHLVRALEEGGESTAAELVAKLGSRAEAARELAYRLYNLCERKKRAAEALSYNALVQSWPEIVRLAETAIPRQDRLI
jgi:putative DNA methylase